ncbi:DUF397 domain-containing protein [Actinoplanes sp. NPDC051346]|uniref:DUF397 domain-containing protein n=1 Tax=Actinoplanes sp. NPDC051346 TaxID=3155048 RepID=UPI00341D87DA
MKTIEATQWRKSSYCSNATCVEVARVKDNYLIRDSKSPAIAPLSFTAEEWTAFVRGVNEGQFAFE